jgi:hypothetical protein
MWKTCVGLFVGVLMAGGLAFASGKFKTSIITTTDPTITASGVHTTFCDNSSCSGAVFACAPIPAGTKESCNPPFKPVGVDYSITINATGGIGTCAAIQPALTPITCTRAGATITVTFK